MAHAPSFWLEFRLPNGRSSLKPLSELCPDLPAQCNTIDDFWGVINACPLSEVRDRFDMTLHFFAPGFRPTWESMPNGAVAKLHAANLATSPGAPPTASFDLLWPVACALVLQWSDPKYHQSLAACSIVGVSSGLDVVKFWIADVSNSNMSACESCRAAWPLEFQASSIDAFKSELSAAMRRAAETAFPESAFPTLAVSLQSNAVAMRKSQRTDSRGGSGHVRQGSNHHHHHNHHHRAHERNVSFGESTNSVDWMSSRGSQVGGIHSQGQPSSNMASPGHGRTRSGIDPFSTSLTGPISLGTPRVGHGRSWSDLSSSPIVSIRVNNPYATAVSPPMTAMPPPASMSQSVNPPSRGATPLVSVRVGNVLVGTSPVATFQMPPSAPMPVPVLLDVKRAMAPEPDARSSPPPAPTVSTGHTRVTSEGTAWNRNSSHTSNAKAPQAKEKESVVAVPETTNSAGNSRSNSVLITDDVTPPPSKSATPSTKKTRRGRRAGQKVRERDTFNALATMFKTDEDFEDHGETTPRPATQLSASNAAAGDSDDDNSVVVGRLSPSRLEDVATGHSLDGGGSLQPGHVFMAAAGGSMASLTSPGIRRNDSITQFVETPPAKGGERRSHGRTVSFEVPAPQQHEHRSTSVGSNSSAQHFVHPTHQRRLSDVTTPIPASDPALPHLAAVRKLGSTQGWLELLSLDDEFYSDD